MSELCLVEVFAALARKEREGEMSEYDRVTCECKFLDDFNESRFAVIELGNPTLATATEYPSKHALRSMDAIQLACAWIARTFTGVNKFVTFDRTLARAAFMEGYRVLPEGQLV